MRRRDILIGLATIPLATVLRIGPLAAQGSRETPSRFLKISRILTGNDTLSQGIADRIEGLLKKDAGFGARFTTLADAMEQAGGDRAAQIAALDDEQVSTALSVAKPWYLGYLGSPSGLKLTYEAEFATYLEAQAYEKLLPQVPRPTYPPGSAGWWSAVPEGVTSPPMPDGILNYDFHPAGEARTIQEPDPAWLAYANAKHADYDAAVAARPTSGAVPIDTSATGGTTPRPASDRSAPRSGSGDR